MQVKSTVYSRKYVLNDVQNEKAMEYETDKSELSLYLPREIKDSLFICLFTIGGHPTAKMTRNFLSFPVFTSLVPSGDRKHRSSVLGNFRKTAGFR